VHFRVILVSDQLDAHFLL